MDPSPWSVADAKSKLSEVLNLAEQRAQIITRRNREFVLIDGESYKRLIGERPGVKDLILDGPSLAGLDLGRDRTPQRKVEL